MAERYRREKTLPAYQPGDISGFFAGAQETGRQAAALGQQAQAVGQQARVLEDVSRQFGRWGSDLARQHGMQKTVEPMRDADGNMVPLVQRVSLNISDQVYQQRQVESWGASALNLYKERSQTEAEKFRMDPEGYANAMTEVREQILAQAPGAISGQLSQQMENFAAQVGGGISSFVQKQERQTRDLSIEQGINRSQDSFLIGAIRDGESLWVGDQPNPELYGPESDIGQMFASIPALSSGEQPDDEHTPYHDAMAAEVNRKGLLGWFNAKANSVRQLYRTDPVRAKRDLLQLRRMVEDDQVRVPGWAGKYSEGMSGVTFRNLGRDAQKKLLTEMGRMSERIESEATLSNDIKHEMFQEGIAEDMQALAKDIPAKIQSKDLRNHIEMWAGSQNVSPALVYAMIHRESAYNPEAESPTGVVGMMQVTTGTGMEMAKKLGKKYNPDRTNPYDSTMYGITYLGHLLRDMEKLCPNCNQLQHEALASAAYNVGPAPIRALAKRGIDISNPAAWLPELGKMTSLDGKKVDGKQGMNHAIKVMRSKQAMTGGGMLLLESTSQRAMEQFPNPRDYMRAMNRFHSNWTQANSMKQYNANLVYTPPAYDADMARSFVDDQWSRLYDPSAPNPLAVAGNAAQSIVRMVQQDTEYGHMVRMEAFRKASAAMKSGSTEQARSAQQLLSMQGGVLHTRSDAKKLDKMIPGGTDPNVLETFLSGAEGGRPMAAEAMARYSIGGLKRNGRLGIETMNLTDQGLRSLASGGWTVNQVREFTGLLDQLYGGAPEGQMHMMSPEALRAAQTVWQSRDNMRRLFPGPSGSGANMLAAIDYARENKEAFAKNDTKTMRRLNQILHGRGPAEAWEMQPVEMQTALTKEIYDIAVTGAPRLREQLGVRALKSMDQVTSSFANIVARNALNMRTRLDKDTVGAAADFGLEEAARRGHLGFSEYTYDVGVLYNEGYDPTSMALVSNPIENYFNTGLSVPKPDVYAQFGQTDAGKLSVEITGAEFDQTGARIKEKVPVIRGTLQGAAQAAFDDYGEQADAAKEMAEGKLQFFVVDQTMSPEGRPSVLLQAMRFERIEGTNKGEWLESIAFDTGEMEDVAATWEFAQAHQQASALAAPMIDVSEILRRLGGEFRYQEPRYGDEGASFLGRLAHPGAELRREAYNVLSGFGAAPWSTMGRGFFEVEEIPERMELTEAGVKGEEFVTREEME